MTSRDDFHRECVEAQAAAVVEAAIQSPGMRLCIPSYDVVSAWELECVIRRRNIKATTENGERYRDPETGEWRVSMTQLVIEVPHLTGSGVGQPLGYFEEARVK